MSNDTFDSSLCTVATCSVKEYGQIQYIPNLAGNVLYAGIFGLLLACQFFLGIRHKTWGYLTGMAFGLALEIVGYVGRIMLHNNIFDKNSFIIYLIGVTIGPAFLTASIYLCLGRIITVFSIPLALLKPRTITLVFIFCDFISLLLQAIGGAIASTANTSSASQSGVNIMIAGLASQVISLFIFAVLGGHFAFRVWKNPTRLDPQFAQLRNSKIFKGFLFAIIFSTLTIFVRSIYRLAELQQGFNGVLANNQVEFMILEGPMVFLAVATLTFWHPGRVLGHTIWIEAGFHLRKSRETRKAASFPPVYKTTETNSSDGFIMSESRKGPSPTTMV